MIRLTGMSSGLDTEAMITELVKANSTKVTTLQKQQTRLEWKQEAWQDLNSKIYSLFSNTLSTMRFSEAYQKTKTTVSDESKASIVASGSAVKGSQTLTVDSLATSGYLTGGRIGSASQYKEDTTLGSINSDLVGKTISVNGKDITITEETTLSSLASEMSKNGVNASYDAKNSRFFISAKSTGESEDFTIGGDAAALSALGLDWQSNVDGDGNVIDKTGAVRIQGTDAKITLNGAEFTSNTNTFTVNGLTITAKGTTADGEVLSIGTETDYDGIYDTIKGFISKYSELVNEMSKLYNATSNKSMDPLSDDEKSAMTDTQIEQWEEKIKSGILSGDSTISSVRNAMAQIMMEPVEIDGKKVYLQDFGISTPEYFSSGADERYAYHIDGDPDDSVTSGNADKLKAAIAENPELVADFFKQLTNNLYKKLNNLMASSDYSSIYKVYDDKQIKSDLSDYATKITEAQDKLTAMEDKWYAKFSKMETAMSKMSESSSYISSLFGS